MRIGGKIKVLRIDRGLSQRDLADKSGVSKAYISQLERGEADNPSQKKLFGLARALGVDVRDLLAKTSERGSSTEFREAPPIFEPSREVEKLGNEFPRELRKELEIEIARFTERVLSILSRALEQRRERRRKES